MKTKTITIYEYSELSDKAKEKALSKYQESCEHDMLEDQMSERLTQLLKINNIEPQKGFKLLYSLSYCQGDGCCFEGTFKYKDRMFNTEHRSNMYYHERSATITILDYEDTTKVFGEDAGSNIQDRADINTELENEFSELYISICKEVEKYGYDCMREEESEETFIERCKDLEYYFNINGGREYDY